MGSLAVSKELVLLTYIGNFLKLRFILQLSTACNDFKSQFGKEYWCWIPLPLRRYCEGSTRPSYSAVVRLGVVNQIWVLLIKSDQLTPSIIDIYYMCQGLRLRFKTIFNTHYIFFFKIKHGAFLWSIYTYRRMDSTVAWKLEGQFLDLFSCLTDILLSFCDRLSLPRSRAQN